MSKTEKIVRITGTAVCELFTAATIIMLLFNKQYNRLPLAIITLFIIFVPLVTEKIFRCKISLPVYIFTICYFTGPMLGQCYNLYYLLSWWDKMLHILGGVLFSLFGIFLFERFSGSTKKRLLFTAVFALCFSVTVSALWEFAEFGADVFSGTDMQHDTVVTSINSYLLGNGIGVVGSIGDIIEVVINGRPLPFNGYIDLGLIDTMLDMLLEAQGSVAILAVYLIDKGKHPAFIQSKGDKNKPFQKTKAG